MSTDPAETIALSRFRVIADATNPRLSPAERGQIVRELARQSHEQPDGSSRVYSRGTLDRWVRAYRDQGLDGLKPQPRADIGAVRHHPEFLEEAARLRHELPARSAAQISAILLARHGVRVAQRTIRAHLQRRGLGRGSAPSAGLEGQDRATPAGGRPGENPARQLRSDHTDRNAGLRHADAAGSTRATSLGGHWTPTR